MDAIEVDGEFIEVVGPRQAKVRSRSQELLWYAVDLDANEGRGACTCKGFAYRENCRHLETARRFVNMEAVPAALSEPDTIVRFALVTGRYQLNEFGGRLPIGITRRLPRWKLPYALAATVMEAAPTAAQLKISGDAEFTRSYRARLDEFGVGHFRRVFSEIARKHDKLSLALLCYEDLTKPGEFCHRRVFAQWWQEQTGQEVPELQAIPGRLA
jgi:hypothetical protein